MLTADLGNSPVRPYGEILAHIMDGDPLLSVRNDVAEDLWRILTPVMNAWDDGTVPIDNNHIEQQVRPWALGRKNWLFAGSLRSGQRAAALMSLIQSAKLNGHDAYAYLKDVLTRLPTQRASEIGELLPHRWQSA